MRIVFCGFGNPDNRGCEAIIRTTSAMARKAFPNAKIIATSNDYGITPMLELDTVDKYEYSYYPHSGTIDNYIYAGLRRIFGSAFGWCAARNRGAYNRIGKVQLCISVGGDNFCYGNSIEHFLVHHAHFKQIGAKLIHWGTSFEKDLLSSGLVKDLNTFDAIMVRESLSFEALKEKNISTPIYLIPDPAFTMNAEMPDNCPKLEQDCVGINISPMVVSKETQSGVVLKNSIALINHITRSGKQVVLIPHVCNRKNGDGDYSIMKSLLDKIESPNRCVLIGFNYSAPEIKYIISQCSMFIGARTHATIAAYSTCVPTVVIGYSIKARGIARDLFGTEENFVLPVQLLRSETEFVKAYKFLNNNREQIKNTLKKIMPEYINQAESAVKILKLVMDNNEEKNI